MAEHHRINGQKRWAGMTADERREASLPARRARGRVVDLVEQVDALTDVLTTDVLPELRALRAEVAQLREEREPVAA